MNDWKYIDARGTHQLAQLHYFTMVRRQENGEVEFKITVREHATAHNRGMHFYAEADKQTNQSTAPFTPCGWGTSLGEALSQCITAINRFPYEGPQETND